MRIIGISGKRGAGKDTAAALIQELTGPFLKWQNAKFADKLKQITAILTGEPLELMHTQDGKAKYLPEWGLTIGELQQKLGTEAIRQNLNDRAWLLALFGGFKNHNNYIITDVRFPNEAEEIRKRGGVVLRLEGNPVGLQGDGTRDETHPSETALDEYQFDMVIQNTGSLKDLYSKIYSFLFIKNFI